MLLSLCDMNGYEINFIDYLKDCHINRILRIRKDGISNLSCPCRSMTEKKLTVLLLLRRNQTKESEGGPVLRPIAGRRGPCGDCRCTQPKYF